MDLRKLILSKQDAKYKEFQSKLIPSVDPSKVIGVRIPELRRIAKGIKLDESRAFLSELPHLYYEENNLHSFIIERIGDFSECVNRVEEFLPFIDNWATCDGMLPRCFKGAEDRLLPYILRWLESGHTYTVRYGIVLLMKLYLGDKFNTDFLGLVGKRCCDDYYVNMAVAWYFATAMAVRFEEVASVIAGGCLSNTVLGMTVRKAKESRRVTEDTRRHLSEIYYSLKKI